MGQKRMTVLTVLAFAQAFLSKLYDRSMPRVQTATDSAFTARWLPFALCREHRMYWQSKIKRSTILCSFHHHWVHRKRRSILACHSGSHLAIQKTVDRLMRYLAFTVSVLLLCMKSTASKVYRGENKRLFLLWLLLLFCTTAQRTKPRHFL